MKLIAEIEITSGLEPIAIDSDEIKNEIAGAVSACEGLEDLVSVEVTKLTIVHGRATKENGDGKQN